MNGNKPDWKDAPEWAKYLAMDANGRWYWYELEPEIGRNSFKYYRGHIIAAHNYNELWKTSLEERPE